LGRNATSVGRTQKRTNQDDGDLYRIRRFTRRDLWKAPKTIPGDLWKFGIEIGRSWKRRNGREVYNLL